MKKISSSGTVIHKKILPIIWFGGLAVFLAMSIRSPIADREAIFHLVPLCIMAGVGFVVMKKLAWDLVDEVHDAGDYLLVRNGDQQERVPLDNTRRGAPDS